MALSIFYILLVTIVCYIGLVLPRPSLWLFFFRVKLATTIFQVANTETPFYYICFWTIISVHSPSRLSTSKKIRKVFDAVILF